MKKFLFIFALAAIFSITATPVKANSFISKNSDVVLTADVDDVNTVPEGDKKKDDKKKSIKTTTSCCSAKAAAKTGCSEAQKKSCAASKVSCSETKSEKKEDKK